MHQLLRVLENEDLTYLSDTQYIVAFSFGILSCTLSLFGSTSIMYIILKTKRLNSLYHRLMFGLSSMDLIVTTGIFLQPFLLPQSTGYPFAKGNEASCNATAFLMQYFLASFMYNAELSIYFLKMVRYGKSEAELSRKLEPYVHIIPTLTATLFSVLGVSFNLFGPHPVLGTCQFDISSGNQQHVAYGVMWAHASVTTAAILIGIVCTWLIYWTVHQQEKRNKRWSFSGKLGREERQRRKAVGMQAIWYTTAVLVGFFALILGTIVSEVYSKRLKDEGQLSSTAGLYTAYFLVWLLFPLQGFFNWIIYTRPRLLRWRDANPDQTWFWAYRQVLAGRPAPTANRTAHLASNNRLPGQRNSQNAMTDAERMETASNQFSDDEEKQEAVDAARLYAEASSST